MQKEGSENTAAAIIELSASIAEVAAGAAQSQRQLSETNRATDICVSSGSATTKAMGDIVRTAGEISKAVIVIQEIARRTNLLSLNAAIESVSLEVSLEVSPTNASIISETICGACFRVARME